MELTPTLAKDCSLKGCSAAITVSHGSRCDSPSCKPEEQAPPPHTTASMPNEAHHLISPFSSTLTIMFRSFVPSSHCCSENRNGTCVHQPSVKELLPNKEQAPTYIFALLLLLVFVVLMPFFFFFLSSD